MNKVLDDHKGNYTWHFRDNCAATLDELFIQEILFVKLSEEIKTDLNDELNDLKTIY